jgi:hypothetical protein
MGDNSKLVGVIKTEEIIFISSMFRAIQLACCPCHLLLESICLLVIVGKSITYGSILVWMNQSATTGLFSRLEQNNESMATVQSQW